MYNLLMEYLIFLKNGTKIGPNYLSIKNLNSRNACIQRINNIKLQIADIMDGTKNSYFNPDPFGDQEFIFEVYKGKCIAHIHFAYEIKVIDEKSIAEETK